MTSQAFGANNLYLTGIYLNRGRVILTLFFVFVAIVPLVFGEQILLAIGMDAEVSRLSQIQIWVHMPSTFFYGHYDLQKRWLACMRITFIPMVAMFVAITLHISLCFLFLYYFNMGVIGIALSNTI